MPTTTTAAPGSQNAQTTAYLIATETAALTPAITAGQAFAAAVAAGRALVDGLPSSGVSQALNNAAMMLNGALTQLAQQQAALSPLTETLSSAIPTLIVGQAVTPFAPVVASGGVGAISQAISPALPAGLTYTAGQISGTATAASSDSYTVVTTDQSLPNPQTVSTVFNLSVVAASASAAPAASGS